MSCARLLYNGLNLRICHACYFLQTGNTSSNESRLEYRHKMLCILNSDNFEFQSDDVNSNKKLPLWKRDSPHDIELTLLANSQSARFRSFIAATEVVAILHFEPKYASCRNDSYFVAVIEATVFRRKVNFFLLKATRRQILVPQRQHFRKSNETQQRFIGVEWENVHRARALFHFFKWVIWLQEIKASKSETITFIGQWCIAVENDVLLSSATAAHN